ncbi:MAG: hypothetical protein IT177_02880 [Acidobacteria bacterium]|nr:hypothetical protein [Acidobacteriota bacterium]
MNAVVSAAIEQFGLPVKNVVAGMPPQAAIFVDGSPAFETDDDFKGEVLARHQSTGSPLMSDHPPRLPPAVAGTALRHLPRRLQCGDAISARPRRAYCVRTQTA